MQTSHLALMGGGLTAVAIGAAIVWWTPEGDMPDQNAPAEAVAVVPEATPEPVEETAAVEPMTDAGDQEAVADQELAADGNSAEAAEPVPAVEVPAAEVPAAEVAVEEVAPPTPPRLTEMRFEPDGAVLVSGVAEAGAAISVFVDGGEVERMQAGLDGSFFYVGFLGFSDTPRMLSIVGDPDGAAIEADRTFILDANPEPVVVASAAADDVVPVADAPQVDIPQEVEAEVAEVAPAEVEQTVEEAPQEVAAADEVTQPVEDTLADAPEIVPPSQEDVTETAAAEDVDTVQETPEAVVEPVIAADAVEPVIEEPAPVATPTILAVTEEGVEVVQAPVADTAPEVMSNVALDTITYDPDGDVVLRGRALGEGFVQVYVDNTPISRLPVADDGSWRGDLPDVDKGVYTLRIDEVDAAGDVVSRIETPFLREDPDTVAEAMADQVDDPSFTVATRTVQPGATLWAIAQDRYGAGVAYVTVFEANRDRIRNPDLIYPGQVFVLPEPGN